MLVRDLVHVLVVSEHSTHEGRHLVAEDELKGLGDATVGGLWGQLVLALAQSAGLAGGLNASSVDIVAASLLLNAQALDPDVPQPPVRHISIIVGVRGYPRSLSCRGIKSHGERVESVVPGILLQRNPKQANLHARNISIEDGAECRSHHYREHVPSEAGHDTAGSVQAMFRPFHVDDSTAKRNRCGGHQLELPGSYDVVQLAEVHVACRPNEQIGYEVTVYVVSRLTTIDEPGDDVAGSSSRSRPHR